MSVNISAHPLIQHKMTVMRDRKTSTHEFRRILQELTFHLAYKATAELKTTAKEVVTPMGVKAQGVKISEEIAIIPVLRAGLAMADSMMELLPTASVHHIGMYRQKDSMLPVQYYNKLPKDKTCDIAFICDPCIATSNTLHAVCSIVKRWGAKKIVVISAIGSKEGVDKLHSLHPDIDIFLGAMDDALSEDGMILPGLGDAGDRQFGTPFEEGPPSTLPTTPFSPDAGKRKRDA